MKHGEPKALQPKHIFLGNLMETLDLITNHKWRITKSFRPCKPPTIGGFGPVADVIGEPTSTIASPPYSPEAPRRPEWPERFKVRHWKKPARLQSSAGTTSRGTPWNQISSWQQVGNQDFSTQPPTTTQFLFKLLTCQDHPASTCSSRQNNHELAAAWPSTPLHTLTDTSACVLQPMCLSVPTKTKAIHRQCASQVWQLAAAMQSSRHSSKDAPYIMTTVQNRTSAKSEAGQPTCSLQRWSVSEIPKVGYA